MAYKPNVEMVSMEDAYADKNGEVFGYGSNEASVDAIPDLEALSNNLVDILEYLEKPEVIEMRKNNDSAIRMHLINKYADSVPLKFIDLFMERDPDHKAESIERALRWIEILSKVKSGNADLETEIKKMAHEVNQRYVYSKYGGKENFEKELQKNLGNGKNTTKSRIG